MIRDELLSNRVAVDAPSMRKLYGWLQLVDLNGVVALFSEADEELTADMALALADVRSWQRIYVSFANPIDQRLFMLAGIPWTPDPELLGWNDEGDHANDDVTVYCVTGCKGYLTLNNGAFAFSRDFYDALLTVNRDVAHELNAIALAQTGIEGTLRRLAI